MEPNGSTLCKALQGNGSPCRWRALPGSELCSNHDPALADQRRRAGATRRPRFAKILAVSSEQDFDRAKAPTIAYVIDKLLDVERDLDQLVNVSARKIAEASPSDQVEVIEAKQSLLGVMARVYQTRVNALKSAREALFDEREAARKSTSGIPGAPPTPMVDDELRAEMEH